MSALTGIWLKVLAQEAFPIGTAITVLGTVMAAIIAGWFAWQQTRMGSKKDLMTQAVGVLKSEVEAARTSEEQAKARATAMEAEARKYRALVFDLTSVVRALTDDAWRMRQAMQSEGLSVPPMSPSLVSFLEGAAIDLKDVVSIEDALVGMDARDNPPEAQGGAGNPA